MKQTFWPPFLAILLFFLAPYIWLLLPGAAPSTGASGDSAGALERFNRAIGDTILLATIASAIAALIGGATAILLPGATPPWIRRLILALFLAILAIPTHVHAVGLATAGRALAFLDTFLYSMPGAGALLGWSLSPFVFIPVYAAIRRQPAAWEESALLDAHPLRVLLNVRLRGALPALVAGTALAWILAFGEFTVPDILFARDAGRYHLLATEIQTVIALYFDFQTARRLGGLFVIPPLFAIALLAIALLLHATRAPLQTAHRAIGDLSRNALSPARHPLARAALLLAAILAGLPLAQSLWSLTAAWLRDAEAIAIIWESARVELFHSLLLCSGAALLCVLVGAAASLHLLRARRPAIPTIAFFLITTLPFLLPASLLGLSLLWAFGRPPLLALRDTTLPLALVYLLTAPAFAWPTIHAAHAALPRQLLDMARLDGCSNFNMIRHVIAPLCGPAWLGAFALALLVAMGEAGASMLLAPPGHTPLSVRVLTIMHYGPGPQLAALCLLSAGFSLLTIAAAAFLFGARSWLESFSKFRGG